MKCPGSPAPKVRPLYLSDKGSPPGPISVRAAGLLFALSIFSGLSQSARFIIVVCLCGSRSPSLGIG